MQTKVVFWDVQHGHASYIKSPNDRHIVIDLGIGSYGDSSEIFSPLLHLKNKWGVSQIDYIVVTHPHLDHIDDILNYDELSPKVFSRPKHLSKDEIMKNVRTQDKEKFEKYFEINDRYNIPIVATDINYPYNPDNYGGLKIQEFDVKTCPTDNINNHSLIRVLTYEEMKIVFPGDNEKCSFDKLMEDENFVNSTKDADILLAPHHGRDSGFHSDFVKNVNPRLAVISDGRFCDTSAVNRYSNSCRGWSVHTRRGKDEDRKCLTTRSDGVIVVEFGKSSPDSRFLSVTID